MKLLRKLVRWGLGDVEAQVFLNEMEELYGHKVEVEGRAAAERWRRRELRRAVFHALATRLRRRPRPAGSTQRPADRVGRASRSRGWESLFQDVRVGLRTFRRSPFLAAVAVMILGLGVGATTGAFGFIHAVLLEPLPYPNSDRLVTVFTSWAHHPTLSPDEGDYLAVPDLLDLRDGSRSLASLVGYERAHTTLTWAGEPIEVEGALVSEGLLSTFQLSPALGRDIRPDESGPGMAHVAVIGYALWRNRFGQATDVIGRSINVAGAPFEIVGVAPKGFDFPGGTELWVPEPRSVENSNRRTHVWLSVGRLRDGATLAAARSELVTIASRLSATYPESNAGKSVIVRSLKEDVVRQARPGLLLLLGATIVVLLVAGANVANLLLIRSLNRTGEFAVRAALGAGRGRVARQVIVESALFAVAGGVVGILLAAGGVHVARAAAGGRIPRLDEVAIDGTVFLFALGVVAVTALVVGASPLAHVLRIRLADGLRRAGGRSQASKLGPGLRRFFIAAQVALSVVLVSGAGLLLRSLWELKSIDVGFETHNVLRFSLATRGTLDEVRTFYRTLEETIAGMPGVASVGSIQGAPLGPWHTTSELRISGEQPPEPGAETYAGLRPVSPHYLETMRIPLVRGRTLTPADDAPGSRSVAVVNEAFVRENFPAADPLGQRVRVLTDQGYGSPEWTIVGVVKDIRSESLTRPPIAEIYVPQGHFGPGTMTVAVRGASVTSLVPAIRTAVHALDRRVSLRYVETVHDAVHRETAPARSALLLGVLLAGVALLLAVVGLHAVLGYLVSLRTREIGVRVALGADPGRIVRLVVRDGLRVMVLGALGGIVVSPWSNRALGSLLYGVRPGDPWALVLLVLVLTIAGVAAMLIPVRRACGVDPVRALRAE
jgi:putative ABC transport system permease protein